MDAGHAQAALENKEGAERARADFEAGTPNPFTKADGWRAAAWDAQTRRLVCLRDDDRTKCCSTHDRHLSFTGRRSQWGLSSCSLCEAEVDELRIPARYNEPHNHGSQSCICWTMGVYAERTCRGTCHLVTA